MAITQARDASTSQAGGHHPQAEQSETAPFLHLLRFLPADRKLGSFRKRAGVRTRQKVFLDENRVPLLLQLSLSSPIRIRLSSTASPPTRLLPTLAPSRPDCSQAPWRLSLPCLRSWLRSSPDRTPPDLPLQPRLWTPPRPPDSSGSPHWPRASASASASAPGGTFRSTDLSFPLSGSPSVSGFHVEHDSSPRTVVPAPPSTIPRRPWTMLSTPRLRPSVFGVPVVSGHSPTSSQRLRCPGRLRTLPGFVSTVPVVSGLSSSTAVLEYLIAKFLELAAAQEEEQGRTRQ